MRGVGVKLQKYGAQIDDVSTRLSLIVALN